MKMTEIMKLDKRSYMRVGITLGYWHRHLFNCIIVLMTTNKILLKVAITKSASAVQYIHLIHPLINHGWHCQCSSE